MIKMKQVPKISIIVPIYNSEKYLSQCVESVLRQDYSNFELLLINDGSIDNSIEICRKYSQIDSRIKVFHKNNGGVSSARNYGLDRVTGEWVTFLDSDDELSENYLLSMIKPILVDDKIDFAIWGYEYYNAENDTITYTTSVSDSCLVQILDKDFGIKMMYEGIWSFWKWFICSKLFKMEILRENKIKFNEHIKFGEDRLFIMEYICAISNRMCFSSDNIYRYRIHSESTNGRTEVVYNEESITGVEATICMYEKICKIETTKYNCYLALRDLIYSYRTQKKIMVSFSVDKLSLNKLDIMFYNVVSKYKYCKVLIFEKFFSCFPQYRSYFVQFLFK